MKYYKFALHKSYFDRGYGITGYIKLLIILFGLYSFVAELPMEIMLAIGLLYGVSCYFIGRIWYTLGIVIAEHEVDNQFNLFQKELRERFK